MARVEEDKDREKRIAMEILVNMYEEDQLYLGWYYFVNKIRFSFRGRCVARKGAGP